MADARQQRAPTTSANKVFGATPLPRPLQSQPYCTSILIGLNGSNRMGMGMKWVYFGSKSENFTGFWRVWVPGFKRFPDSRLSADFRQIWPKWPATYGTSLERGRGPLVGTVGFSVLRFSRSSGTQNPVPDPSSPPEWPQSGTYPSRRPFRLPPFRRTGHLRPEDVKDRLTGTGPVPRSVPSKQIYILVSGAAGWDIRPRDEWLPAPVTPNATNLF